MIGNAIDQQSAERGRILVVDDMELHLETAKMYLEIAGFEVYCAADGRTAWSMVKEKRPDVVLLDVMLPGENGLNLLSKIRTHYPSIEVIIITAFGSEDIAAAALKLGASDYIRKPFKYGNLGSVVGKSLARKRDAESREKAVESLKHAYEELQVSADTILQCMAAGVVAVDYNLLIRTINHRAECFFGVSGSEVVGKPCYDVFPFIRDTGLFERVIEEKQGERFDNFELPINGRSMIFAVDTDVLLDQRSNVIGAVAVFNDVTEVRRMEKALRERERLAMIGQMVAGIVHEIKNPLTVIKGFAQIISSKNKDPVLNEYMDIMVSEVDRINQVALNFLELSRPKAPEFVRMNINELLGSMSPVIKSQTYSKNISVEIAIDDRIPAGLMDPNQIKQLLLNLVQNAVEAMEKGGLLRITTAFLDEQKEIRLDIADTGCGIPEDMIENLGVPFQTTKRQGTGLGLSICHSIVDQHKGRIEVRSEVSRGTTFSVFLPVGA